MEQFLEFVAHGESIKFCNFKKAIYVLKQSLRAWFDKLNQILIDFWFLFYITHANHSVFMKKTSSGVVIFSLH